MSAETVTVRLVGAARPGSRVEGAAIEGMASAGATYNEAGDTWTVPLTPQMRWNIDNLGWYEEVEEVEEVGTR